MSLPFDPIALRGPAYLFLLRFIYKWILLSITNVVDRRLFTKKLKRKEKKRSPINIIFKRIEIKKYIK